jgi:hypothetical protein
MATTDGIHTQHTDSLLCFFKMRKVDYCAMKWQTVNMANVLVKHNARK